MATCNGRAAFGIRTKRLKTIDTVIKQPLRPICGDWFKKIKKRMENNQNEWLVKCMPVNPIQMNLYVLYQRGGAGAIIDPGCCEDFEFENLFSLTEKEQIKIEHILLTHPHFDHIMGAARVCQHYGLPLELHEKAVPMVEGAIKSMSAFGLPMAEVPKELKALKDKECVRFGGTLLETRYTPGHCEGSVCYVWPDQKTVFSGDVLFHGSIGRTDFPTGDLDMLRKSIAERLFMLEDDYTVRPGHGGRTSIGYEKYNNPFL